MSHPLDRAWAAAELGRYADAERLARVALADAPDDTRALILLSRSLLKQEKYKPALQAAEQAVAAGPDEADCHLELALVHASRYDGAKAVDAASAGVALDPDSSYAHQVLGESLRMADRFDEARTAGRRAAELDPDAAGPWRLIGQIYLECDHLDAAENAFREALRRSPDSPGALAGMANVERGRRRVRRSLRGYLALARTDPTDDHSERLSWPIIESARALRWWMTAGLLVLAAAAMISYLLPIVAVVRVAAAVLAVVLVGNMLLFLVPAGRLPWRALRLASRWRRLGAYATLLMLLAIVAMLVVLAVVGVRWWALVAVGLLVPYWAALAGYWVALLAEDRGFRSMVGDAVQETRAEIKQAGREIRDIWHEDR